MFFICLFLFLFRFVLFLFLKNNFSFVFVVLVCLVLVCFFEKLTFNSSFERFSIWKMRSVLDE